MFFENDYQILVLPVDSLVSFDHANFVIFNFSHRTVTIDNNNYFHIPFGHTSMADLNVYSRRVNNLIIKNRLETNKIIFACDQAMNRSLFMAMYFLHRILSLDKTKILALAVKINPYLDPFFLRQFLSC